MATNAFAFMGVSEDVRRYEETTKALEHSDEFLNMIDYCKVVGYEDGIDEVWHNLSKKPYIIVDDMILEWLGLDRKQRRMSRSMFVNMLKSNEIKYFDFTGYPEKWIIMGARDFKKMVMSLETTKGDAVHRYYINMSTVFRMHCEYTLHFMKRQTDKLKGN